MRFKMGLAALLAGVSISGAAAAQSGPLDGRVGRLEKEMKAVQRTVFPNGLPVQPENGVTVPATATGSPASARVTDLTARIDALEKGLASLTGQIEQANYTNRQQDEAIKRLESRLAAADRPTATDISTTTAPAKLVASPRLGTSPSNKSAVVATKPDAARKAKIAAVELPDTGDTAEDAYSYGFRLYSAKLYPEAETKLKEFVAKYPSHKRASYAQNLLGRAYYDEGKPALASVAFYDNYQKMPKGDRAPESLYWLGQALTKLRKLPDACKVYDELREVYGTKMGNDMKVKAAKGRADAKCAA